MKAFLALLLALTIPLCATAQSIQGTYKLVTFDVQIGSDPPRDYFGKVPNGYIIITPTRMMTVITAEGRRPARSPEEKAALLDALIAYTGPYRIEGRKLITAVDASWSEAWTGTQQGRTITVEGNRLTLVTDPAPFLPEPSKMIVARLVGEKIE
jgi:hypothetical protein